MTDVDQYLNRPMPATLEQTFLRAQNRYKEAAGTELGLWLERQQGADPAFATQLRWVWGCSEFVSEACVVQPELLKELAASGDLQRSYATRELRARVHTALTAVEDEDTLLQVLRTLRRREMVRIVWRDFTRMATMEQTTAAVTDLADSVIDVTLSWLYERLCQQRGTPVGYESGQPQKMVVLGMGKQGAHELNISSDVDLIFAFPQAGQTEGSGRPISNQEFFNRLGQQLIKALDARTADGFVFRVDMRLRPYGQSGALVLSFDAMEEYYQNQGRDWERYAMIKARVVAGDVAAGRRLMEMLRPFVYRRYIDFSAIESLRDMKSMIRREVALKGLDHDVKRGAGGIREVEFIAQAFQLIRGGKDHRFQQQQLRSVLALIGREGLLSEETAERLYHAYRFLRDVEHALQGWRDQQTHSLPSDETGRLRVAWLMGFDGWAECAAALQHHRTLVAAVFADVVTPLEEPDREDETFAVTVWSDRDSETQLAALSQLGYSAPKGVLAQLDTLRTGSDYATLSGEARKRLDRLMPPLLLECAGYDNDTETLERVLGLVRAVLRRSAYLLLLAENPPALHQLVTLCSRSIWLAEQLRFYPALLDELLDTRTLYTPATPEQLRDELSARLHAVPADDLEGQMDVLRYFKLSHRLRAAACELIEVLPLMKVSDHLTWLAEVIVAQVVELAWAQMRQRHGQPGGDSRDFIVVGYGKLGGIELAHGSDLDLVFIHNADPALFSDGERPLDNASYFARLAQKIIHILTARTAMGELYEVDARLRPSGNAGMLVISLSAFERYQQADAWTWEHQALVRARPVAGSPALATAFETVRHRILCQPRDRCALRRDVSDMRARMREHLASRTDTDPFQLKQDAGGIVDIEFMVQFAVLAWAHEWPILTRWSDNIRILETLSAEGVLSEERGFSVGTAERLIEVYKAYRAAAHRLQLQHLPATVEADEFVEERTFVSRCWQQLLGADSQQYPVDRVPG